MSKAATKTDNSELEAKVLLRLESLDAVTNSPVRVLECYGGNGTIWKEVKSRTQREIKILRIEKQSDRAGVYLKGDNLKFLGSIDFSDFDIVDLDAYGIPFAQIKMVFKKRFHGVVHVTAIQSAMGMLPTGLLTASGYSKEMLKKCRTLFCKNGDEKLLGYLAKNGVVKIRRYKSGRKNYFWFHLLQSAENE